MKEIIESEILSANRDNYHDLYSNNKNCLMYPADWVIRFHNMYLKNNKPNGRVLDYGCGSGNNSMFFIEKGYEVYGTDVTESIFELIKKNLAFRHLDRNLISNFSVFPPNAVSLPFEDRFFDFILSNQVLYYLPSKEYIKAVCKEMSRCLAQNGIVFFTMMGPKNYYIQEYTKKVLGNVHEMSIEDKNHRLYGVKEFIYVVNNKEELIDLFSEFDCISAGHFEQSMLDMSSNFHWIFIGKKRK